MPRSLPPRHEAKSATYNAGAFKTNMMEREAERAAVALNMVVARAGKRARENTETVRALLSAERQHTAQLLREGRITSAYLALDGATVFLLIPGLDDESIRTLLRTFPLYDYLEWETHPVRDGLPDEV